MPSERKISSGYNRRDVERDGSRKKTRDSTRRVERKGKKSENRGLLLNDPAERKEDERRFSGS